MNNKKFKFKLLFILFIFLLNFNLFYSLSTCNHASASSPSSMPSDIDYDGIKDEYCFKDSGNCGCNGVSSNCYGCWRDLKPPYIKDLRVCYIKSGKKVCKNLDLNNPVFVVSDNDENYINITWSTDENAKCLFRYVYDNSGNETDLSLTNPDVKYSLLPNFNTGYYSRNFLVSLNQSGVIRFEINCFDKDTLEGPNYPPNVEVDKSCDVLNDITRVDTCKYKGSIGPVVILDKDKYDYVEMFIKDSAGKKVFDEIYYYQARKILGLDILLEDYIFKYLRNDNFCTKEGTYTLEIVFNESSNNLVYSYNYSWKVNWDSKKYCKKECVGKEVLFLNNTCCGDDFGEYPKYRSCSGACITNFSDVACCSNKKDCVYNGKCFSDGTKIDVDSDGHIEVCSNGIWLPKGGLTFLSTKLSTKDNLKIDKNLIIEVNASVEPGNKIKKVLYIFKNKEKESYLLDNYNNETLNVNKNITLTLFKNHDLRFRVNKIKGSNQIVIKLNKKDIDPHYLQSIVNGDELANKFLIFENEQYAYLLLLTNKYKKNTSISVSLLDYLFLPKFAKVSLEKGEANSFYLGQKEFSSNTITVNNNIYNYYKVICLDNNKLIPFKLEGNNLKVLENCSNKLLLSKLPESESQVKINFEPSIYLKFR
jgi:hypothetical protein